MVYGLGFRVYDLGFRVYGGINLQIYMTVAHVGDSVEAVCWDTIWNKIVPLKVVNYVCLEDFKGQDPVKTKFDSQKICG